MMNLSEIRAKARGILSGKWSTAVLIMLVYGAIMYGAQLISNFTGGILSIAVTICSVPIQYGLYSSYMKLRNNEKVEVADFLKDGFKNFGRSWGVVGNTLLKMWPTIVAYVVGVILLVVSIITLTIGSEASDDVMSIMGVALLVIAIIVFIASLIWMIVRELSFALANFIAIEQPDKSTKEAVEQSAELMNGNRGKYFLLGLSFIGWGFLCLFTLGIGFLWLTPYITIAEIVFYDMLSGKTENNIEVNK